MQDRRCGRHRAQHLPRPRRPARSRGRDVEDRHLEILAAVKAAVSVPVAVKLSPYFSSTGEMALRARRRRAPTGWCSSTASSSPTSTPRPMTVRHRRHPVLPGRGPAAADLDRDPAPAGARRRWPPRPGSRRPRTWSAYLLAGADVVMTASALLRHGPAHAATLTRRARATGWSARGTRRWPRRAGVLAVGADVDAHRVRAGRLRPRAPRGPGELRPLRCGREGTDARSQTQRLLQVGLDRVEPAGAAIRAASTSPSGLTGTTTSR